MFFQENRDSILQNNQIEARMVNEKEYTPRQLTKRATLFKALGNPIRLEIVYFLAKGEKNVTEITNYSGSKTSNISRHLAKLRRSGVVLSRKSGLSVYYRLNQPFVTQTIHNFRLDIGRR